MGPFKVLLKLGEEPSQVAYKLMLPPHFKIHSVFHVSQLKRYHQNGAYSPPSPALLVEGEEEFEVDSQAKGQKEN